VNSGPCSKSQILGAKATRFPTPFNSPSPSCRVNPYLTICNPFPSRRFTVFLPIFFISLQFFSPFSLSPIANCTPSFPTSSHDRLAGDVLHHGGRFTISPSSPIPIQLVDNISVVSIAPCFYLVKGSYYCVIDHTCIITRIWLVTDTFQIKVVAAEGDNLGMREKFRKIERPGGR
jgi:hypothetical protein